MKEAQILKLIWNLSQEGAYGNFELWEQHQPALNQWSTDRAWTEEKRVYLKELAVIDRTGEEACLNLRLKV